MLSLLSTSRISIGNQFRLNLFVNDDLYPPIIPPQIYVMYFAYTSHNSINVIFFYINKFLYI